MKHTYTLFLVTALAMLFSCQDQDPVFEKTADERSAEAIAALKDKLIAPENGWRLQYKPEADYGSYNVLLKFDENDNVSISTDFGVNDGEFYEQTITYRIDNLLNMELVLENYCFFSYLFELGNASFGAEFEFNYVGESGNNLVFNSKTDGANPTQLTFQPAGPDDENLLGRSLAGNLDSLSASLDILTKVYKISYVDRDLALYVNFDELVRTISFDYASNRAGTANGRILNFTTSYLIQGDSMIFDTPFTGNLMGSEMSVGSIRFNQLSASTLNICDQTVPASRYDGSIASQAVFMEPTLLDPNGAVFYEQSSLFFSPLSFIINGERTSAEAEITESITGAVEFDMYYNASIDGEPFYAIGFLIVNADETQTIALKRFEPTLEGNNLVFTFEPELSIFGNPQTDANLDNVNIYLNYLTEGNSTRILKYSDTRYEFYNPCSGWSFVMIPAR